MSIEYTDLQLDALRELANIGSGKASTALSMLLGRAVDISVPTAHALSFADAVEATGDYEQEITGIVLGIVGDLDGVVLLLITPEDADTVCRILGVEPGRPALVNGKRARPDQKLVSGDALELVRVAGEKG